jgi:hypothetical protein
LQLSLSFFGFRRVLHDFLSAAYSSASTPLERLSLCKYSQIAVGVCLDGPLRAFSQHIAGPWHVNVSRNMLLLNQTVHVLHSEFCDIQSCRTRITLSFRWTVAQWRKYYLDTYSSQQTVGSKRALLCRVGDVQSGNK